MPSPIRSYHRAFNAEMLIHKFGDWQPYRPLAVRQVFWTFIFVVAGWIIAHLVGLHLPLLSFAWAIWYFTIPVAAGWVFGTAEIEGRKLHVVAPVWFRHVTSPKRLVSGFNPPPKGPDRLKARKVRVR